MGLKFRSKNTQMKQKKRFLCGNNGNSLSFRSKTSLEKSAYLTEYQHQTRDRKFLRVLRASDVASINSIMTVFEQQSNERTQ